MYVCTPDFAQKVAFVPALESQSRFCIHRLPHATSTRVAEIWNWYGSERLSGLLVLRLHVVSRCVSCLCNLALHFFPFSLARLKIRSRNSPRDPFSFDQNSIDFRAGDERSAGESCVTAVADNGSVLELGRPPLERVRKVSQ